MKYELLTQQAALDTLGALAGFALTDRRFPDEYASPQALGDNMAEIIEDVLRIARQKDASEQQCWKAIKRGLEETLKKTSYGPPVRV